MARKTNSLFDQTLDRSVFVAFFLGAVTPLLGFAVVSERLMPALESRDDQIALASLVVTTGFLSLGAFLALRRIVARTLADITDQNDRLESLLLVARELADAPHAQIVAETASVWAARLTDADASWMVTREDWDKPFTVLASRGGDAEAWLEACGDEWRELASRHVEAETPIRIDGEGSDAPSVVLVPVALETEPGAHLVVARRERAFSPNEVDAVATLAAQTGVAWTSADRGDSQRNFFSHMTDLVVAALDTHVQYRSGHSSRVSALANRVGRAMGVEDDALHDLHFAALLHDVGMLRIPPAHQRDPKFFRKHATVGARMLSRIRVWEGAAPIVGQHHERPDGTGYPDGLVGDDIVLGARILAVCDAWDAMRTEDYHRPAISEAEALAELRENVGGQFDGDVVAALEALVREGGL
ncbi:MAG: HD domain-containing protein [bacterium]|nr:HD domain-containing protein [bacterium]